MTMDLTGGMDLSEDEVTTALPPTPEYREGTSMWIWDDAGRVGLPRIAVEALGATWDTARNASVNVALPDGRVLTVREDAAPHPVADAQGRSRVLGTGPLRFECLEPFDRWRMTFDGTASTTTVQDQIARCTSGVSGHVDPEPVPLRIAIDTRMAAPPWIQGSLDPDGHFVVGERRFEQLFTAEGTVEIDDTLLSFRGGGLRIHRKGGARSDYSDWYGHCWQSAVFPSGRAFGYIHYTPRPDGSVKYHEGWVLDDGEVLAAKVIDTPWKHGWAPAGDDVSLTLRTTRGDVAITAETRLSTFSPTIPMGGDVAFPPVQQGIAHYRWDDEEAYGMIERSIRADLPAGYSTRQ
jgi:hypothetical protein